VSKTKRVVTFSLSPQWGENSPNCSSRIEPLNRSSRRQKALTDLAKQMEPPDVGCYEIQGSSRLDCLWLTDSLRSCSLHFVS
jgi:hypothetical protein